MLAHDFFYKLKLLVHPSPTHPVSCSNSSIIQLNQVDAHSQTKNLTQDETSLRCTGARKNAAKVLPHLRHRRSKDHVTMPPRGKQLSSLFQSCRERDPRIPSHKLAAGSPLDDEFLQRSLAFRKAIREILGQTFGTCCWRTN